MKLFRILAIAALAMVSSASAQAGIVFSNLGTTGTNNASIGSTNTNLNSDSRLAVGFKTGGSLGDTWTLSSYFGAFYQVDNPGVVATTVAIFSSVAGNPGAQLFTATANVGDSNPGGGPKSLYQFDFNSPSGVTLSANTDYFLVPLVSGASTSFAWYRNTSETNGTQRNTSGWSHNTISFSDDNGSTWSGFGGNGFTIAFDATLNSSNPVPEPALTSLLCLGGVALIRRRMKK
jgi:hypothetical protein